MTKDHVIRARISAEEMQLIEDAARMGKLSVSRLLRDASKRYAELILSKSGTPEPDKKERVIQKPATEVLPEVVSTTSMQIPDDYEKRVAAFCKKMNGPGYDWQDEDEKVRWRTYYEQEKERGRYQD